MNIDDINNDLALSVTMLGIFEANRDDTIWEKQLSYIFDSATTTIMFPYLRYYIFTLTSLSGNTLINIPIINVAKALKSNKYD